MYPLTGEIVAIGMLNPDTMKGRVFFQAPAVEISSFEENGIRYEVGSEKEILEKFWNIIKSYDQFITFNGRAFDCPFIIIRSAIHKVKPSRDLMPNRYSNIHIDILEQLTFYGTIRKFSLKMWCNAFGIKNPKQDGISGNDIKRLFYEKQYLRIAKYCIRDVIATKELLNYWENYIKF